MEPVALRAELSPSRFAGLDCGHIEFVRTPRIQA
jgi:hypothetical protein